MKHLFNHRMIFVVLALVIAFSSLFVQAAPVKAQYVCLTVTEFQDLYGYHWADCSWGGGMGELSLWDESIQDWTMFGTYTISGDFYAIRHYSSDNMVYLNYVTGEMFVLTPSGQWFYLDPATLVFTPVP